MGNEIYILDLIGTLTFAFYGAYIGIKKQFDIFGIFATAFLTAVGGGTLREILLNHIPGYFSNMHYIIAICIGIIFAIISYPLFSKINKYALIVDAIGLATFALIGAESALASNLGGFAIILFATVSAVGGGLLRDIAIAETPQIFYRDFYASPAIVLGILFVVFRNHIGISSVVYAILLASFILRLVAIYFRINLWGPWRNS